MIEETATVTHADDAFAWVETARQSACGTCAARGGCGTAVLGRVLGQRRTRIRAINTIGAREGDRVIIGLAESALVQGSLAMYLAPVLAMLLAAGAGQVFASNLGLTSGEAVVVAGGLLGMLGGLAWVRGFARRVRYDERYQPVLVRRLD